MFIAVEHEIHDPQAFKALGETMSIPEDIRLHHLLPSPDGRRASCLLEAPSIDRLRAWHDEDLALSDMSTQTYFQIEEAMAIGLPQHQGA